MARRSLRTRLYQSWFRMARPMTLGVRGVVCNSGGEVLLVRHTYTPGWYFPGGGVERGEPCELSLARELEEEAGVLLDGPVDLVGIYANHANFPNDHVLLYRALQWRQAEATSTGEIAETAFFDPMSPPEGTTPGTRRRLQELFSGADRSPDW